MSDTHVRMSLVNSIIKTTVEIGPCVVAASTAAKLINLPFAEL
jgi:hypothetical protein